MQSPYVDMTGKPTFAASSAIIDHVMHKGYTAVNSRVCTGWKMTNFIIRVSFYSDLFLTHFIIQILVVRF